MDMSLLEILYLVLIIFTSVVWILLSILLYKLLKIVNVLTEMVELYTNIKNVIMVYSNLPQLILWYLKDIVFWSKK